MLTRFAVVCALQVFLLVSFSLPLISLGAGGQEAHSIDTVRLHWTRRVASGPTQHFPNVFRREMLPSRVLSPRALLPPGRCAVGGAVLGRRMVGSDQGHKR